MLYLRRGNGVPFPTQLFEGCKFSAPWFTANVHEYKIKELAMHFVGIHKGLFFFILELPKDINEARGCREITDTHNKDVYYIDGCTQTEALTILRTVGDLLINDGMCSFGFGCCESRDEIIVGKYNVVSIYAENENTYDGFFEEHGIARVKALNTAWDTFSPDFSGTARLIRTAGKATTDIPQMFKEWGIYLAGERKNLHIPPPVPKPWQE